MSYGLRRKPISGNRCRVSSDEGETWSEPIIISEDSPSPDMGYASTAELADGTMVTAWYQFRPEKGVAQLRSARWRFND